ncbi:Putative transferase [Septoria linicola]|uniref:Transferase n=1 Tax=Septoria linicola TaxID=215465 RepID=A0A9Q9EPU7_9PEZI|nr:Putative transferase [Septoria linicola]
MGSDEEVKVSTTEDVIYPLYMLDDTKTLRGIVVSWTLRFNDVLDPARLHNALAELLEIGDWRKAGGRLRSKTGGTIEIHAPKSFSAKRPAVSYSHQAFNVSINDHPVANTLPQATKAPSIHAGPDKFQMFAARQDAPNKLADFLDKDQPLLSLHISSFNDATLVGLSWPHLLMDVMGQQALLRGWSSVLAGRKSAVPPCIGAREDTIAEIADSTTSPIEEYALGKQKMSVLGMIQFGARFAWDMMWNSNVETRTVCIPASAMNCLLKEASDSISEAATNGKQPFVSEGDVLTAWFARAVASSLARPRPVTILHALNARFRLSSLKNSQGIYIQNMAVAAFSYLTADLARGLLGPAALQNRNGLLEHATEAQVLAGLRELRQQHELKPGVDPNIICGDPNAVLMPFTNWTRAELYEAADFSAAFMRSGEEEDSRSNPPGTMVYHHASSMQPNSTARNVIVVLGKDLGGNYWVTGLQLTPAAWKQIENGLAEIESP